MNLLDISAKYLSVEPDKLLKVNKLYEWILVQFEDSDDGISYLKENLSDKELDYALDLHENRSMYMGVPIYTNKGKFSAPTLGLYAIESRKILKTKIREKLIKSNLKKQLSNKIKSSVKENVENNLLKIEEKNEKDPCWKGYTQVGMKKKGNKEVPNCIPSKNISKSKKYAEELELHEAQFILKNVLENKQNKLIKKSINEKNIENIELDENLELFIKYSFYTGIVESIEEMNELLSTISKEDYNYIVNKAILENTDPTAKVTNQNKSNLGGTSEPNDLSKTPTSTDSDCSTCEPKTGTSTTSNNPSTSGDSNGAEDTSTSIDSNDSKGASTSVNPTGSNTSTNTSHKKTSKSQPKTGNPPTVEESTELLKTKKIDNVIINPSKDEDMTAGEKLDKKSMKIASKLKENFSLKLNKKLIVNEFINEVSSANIKSHESPRNRGRNNKSRRKSARIRQMKKARNTFINNML